MKHKPPAHLSIQQFFSFPLDSYRINATQLFYSVMYSAGSTHTKSTPHSTSTFDIFFFLWRGSEDLELCAEVSLECNLLLPTITLPPLPLLPIPIPLAWILKPKTGSPLGRLDSTGTDFCDILFCCIETEFLSSLMTAFISHTSDCNVVTTSLRLKKAGGIITNNNTETVHSAPRHSVCRGPFSWNESCNAFLVSSASIKVRRSTCYTSMRAHFQVAEKLIP